MRQLTFLAPGKFEWRDVAAPRISDDRQAIVRPLAVARCDLDLYIAVGAAPFTGPFAFGHEAVAEVVEAGDSAGVRPGDRVVVPFQISCGDCDNCQRGFTNSCSAVPLYAAYGLAGNGRQDFGGALADLMLVPYANHMLVPLPAGVDPVTAASACDNIADGWRGVAPHLAARPGASVLVVGGLAQSVGIYAAGAAVALGAGRVLYLDDNDVNRACATAMGADVAPLALADGRRADEQFEIVVEAAGNAPALAFAIRSTAPNGMLTSVSMHFAAETPVPLTQAYYRGLTFHTGRVQSRPLLPDVLGCIACGKLHPEHVTHRVASFEEAGDAMADPGPKLVFLP
jgi:threonine dehydrogenase-like Zn-dependent dehydrogenase